MMFNKRVMARSEQQA